MKRTTNIYKREKNINKWDIKNRIIVMVLAFSMCITLNSSFQYAEDGTDPSNGDGPAVEQADEIPDDSRFGDDDPLEGISSGKKLLMKAASAPRSYKTGDTVSYKVQTGDWTEYNVDGMGYGNGWCIQAGHEAKAGTAVITKISNKTLLAKVAYYYGEKKGYNTKSGNYNDAGMPYKRAFATMIQYAHQGQTALDVDHELGLSSYSLDMIKDDVDKIKNGSTSVSVPDNFEVYTCDPSNKSQNFMFWQLGPTSGFLTIKKKATATNTAFLKEVPNNYSLAGAEYQIYTNSGCTVQAKDVNGANAKLITDAGGNTPKLELEEGTYYVKEIKASKGFLTEKNADCSPKVTSVTVTNNNSFEAPYVFESAEEPSYTEPKLKVFKYDSSGTKGWDRLLNAEYTVSYYDIKVPYGNESGVQDPSEINYPSKPTRSWTFKTRKMDSGRASSVMAGFDWDTDTPVSGDPFYTEGGKRILPIGYYTIKETKAPVGLSLNDGADYGKIYQKSNGAEAIMYVNGADVPRGSQAEIDVSEKPQIITIALSKIDAEIGKAEAQEADRVYCNGSLAGAEYEVYFDNDETPAPELIGRMITDEKGEAVLKERTEGRPEALGRELEAGNYYIKEVKASPGYVIDKFCLNGEDTEEIKKGEIEVICAYEADGKAVTKTVKGSFEDGRHLIRARIQSKDTADFKYTITSKETPHHTYVYKKDITSGEELAGATLQVLDSGGNIIEEWVSANKPHDIVALHDETSGLKDGKYTLREITAPYGYDIAEDVEFVVKENVIANKVVMNNKPLKIGTTALSEQTGSHHGAFNAEEKIKDTVALSGLYEGRTYKVSGTVVDKGSGLPLLDKSGNEVTAESEEFIASGDTASIELSFTIDSSEFNDESAVVVFEKLYRISTVHDEDVPVEIARHEDLNDESQTIHYGGIAKTIAADKEDGDDSLHAQKKASLVDTVEYSNLSPKETYFITGVLYDKTSGELTEITSSKEFTPDGPSGTVPVEFKFNASDYENHSLVVFEYLFTEGRMISKHDDVNNEDQTVSFTAPRKSPDTGDMNFLMLFTIITAIAMAALAIMIHHRDKNRDRDL